MANFKTHIGWGAVIGVVAIVLALLYSFISGWIEIFMIFGAILVGSFLPDMDMDDGVPFQILFGFLSVGVAGGVFYQLYSDGQRDMLILFLITGAIFIGLRFVVGEIFMRFTDHRGIWHSIPAAIFMGLVSMRIMRHFSPSENDEWYVYVGIAIMIGYLGHLILDEIYASINLSGHSLLPKRSLGSALKIYSRSKIATGLVYGGIVYLLFY